MSRSANIDGKAAPPDEDLERMSFSVESGRRWTLMASVSYAHWSAPLQCLENGSVVVITKIIERWIDECLAKNRDWNLLVLNVPDISTGSCGL